MANITYIESSLADKFELSDLHYELCSLIVPTHGGIKDWVDRIRDLRETLRKADFYTPSEDQEITDTIKSTVQHDANRAHKEHGRRGIICAATGVGKSKMALDAIKALVAVKPDAKVIIVVPTQKLRDEGWKDEFTQWGMVDIWKKNVVKYCYASLDTIVGNWFDLGIFDEIHNITENNSIFFKQNRVDSVMGLTATKPKKVEKIEVLRVLDLHVVYELTLDEAVKLGVVAPYKITIINVGLSTSFKVKSGTKKRPFFQTERGKHQTLEAQDADPLFNKNKNWFLGRMRFIYNLQSKAYAAKWVLKQLPEDFRTVIFAGSIEQANFLCEHRYHSKSGKKNFEDFQAGVVNQMSCCNALNEGHNLRKVDCGLVVQLNSNELNLIQRIGRIIRFRPGHVGHIIILCAYETVDAKWVAAAISSLDEDNITWINWSDLMSEKDHLIIN